MSSIIKTSTTIFKKMTTRRGYEAVRSKFRKLLRFWTCRIAYPSIYRRGAKKPVNDKKILFVETTADGLSDNFKLLWSKLDAYDYEKHLILLQKTKNGQLDVHRRYRQLVKESGDAKYIFLNDALVAYGHVKFREETTIVNVWHACGAFKKFGFGTADLNFGETREIQEKYPNYTFLDEMYVSSPEVVDKYAYSTGLPEEKVIPLGVGRTDMFFDDDFKKSAEEKFRLFFPEAAGKKVILYAPTFRGRTRNAKSPDALNIPMLHEALSDEYVLVIKEHPFVKKPIHISPADQKFAVNFTKVMGIEELLCVTDICISDYSSLVFEFSLFEKPMIFFAYDRDDYDDWRGFYYDYDEMTPGPILKKNKEIIDYIRHVDERFDRQEVIAFKEKFMSACDGTVTDRIIARIFKDLEEHKKTAGEKNKPAKAASLKKPAGDTGKSPEAVRKFLEEQYPHIKGKRLLAYVTEKSSTESYPHVDPHMNWRTLHEDLPDDIAVIYWHKDQKLKEPPFYTGRFYVMPEELTPCELLRAADMIVTNYCPEAAAYAESKPVYFYIPEMKWTCSSIADYRGKTVEAKEEGLLFETTEELVRAIMNEERPGGGLKSAGALLSSFL